MPDFAFSVEEMRAFAEGSLPKYQAELVFELLADPDLDDHKVDTLGEKFTGEYDESSMIINVGAKRKKNTFWINVKKEVYKAFCTETPEYSKERSIVGNGFENVVSTISGILVAQFNLAAGIATGLSTVALIGVAKVGKNAWCITNKELSD
jgi:hypothetical protein